VRTSAIGLLATLQALLLASPGLASAQDQPQQEPPAPEQAWVNGWVREAEDFAELLRLGSSEDLEEAERQLQESLTALSEERERLHSELRPPHPRDPVEERDVRQRVTERQAELSELQRLAIQRQRLIQNRRSLGEQMDRVREHLEGEDDPQTAESYRLTLALMDTDALRMGDRQELDELTSLANLLDRRRQRDLTRLGEQEPGVVAMTRQLAALRRRVERRRRELETIAETRR
jgi:hypothetical protein